MTYRENKRKLDYTALSKYLFLKRYTKIERGNELG